MSTHKETNNSQTQFGISIVSDRTSLLQITNDLLIFTNPLRELLINKIH